MMKPLKWILGVLTRELLELKGMPVDQPRDAFDKYYPVRFREWLIVWLKAIYDHDASDYVVSISPVLDDPRVRFRVNAMYADTPLGRKWYNEVWPEMIEALKRDCQLWTLQGYPISLSNFEFVIQKFR